MTALAGRPAIRAESAAPPGGRGRGQGGSRVRGARVAAVGLLLGLVVGTACQPVSSVRPTLTTLPPPAETIGTGRATLPWAPLIPREQLFGSPERASPQLSPDGTRLLYVASDEGGQQLRVRTVGQDDDWTVPTD